MEHSPAFKSHMRAKGHGSPENQRVRALQSQLLSIESHIRWLERQALRTPHQSEDGSSPFQKELAQLYGEASRLETELARPAYSV